MRQKAHGILFNDDGSFLLASLEKTDQGWRMKRVRRWNADSAIRNALLLHRGVVAAAPCRWKPSGAPAQASAESHEAFSPNADETTLSIFTQRLSANLLGIVPEDAYLCTIPLAFGDASVTSFVSVRRTGSFYKIGIIINSALAAVFNMAPASEDSLAGHLGRIERYLATRTRMTFPQRLYYLGAGAPGGLTHAASRLDCGRAGIDISDYETLASAGAALSGLHGAVPILSPASGRAQFRTARTAIYAVSAALVVCTILLLAALPVSAFAVQHQLAVYKARYREILSRNADVQSLMLQNDSLARAVLSASDAAFQQTCWAQFLQALGATRPDGLFLDMLGTDAAGKAGSARIAFSGWARNETLVTGFIASLQKNTFLCDISLASLERNESANLFTFRITCTLKFFDASAAK
jgi:Tfp pilus assembly protein PilN